MDKGKTFLKIVMAAACFIFYLIFITFMNSLVYSQELNNDWFKEFTGTFGGCCGKDDCIPVISRIIEDQGEKFFVEVNGIQMVVSKDIVHISEDQIGYWCILNAEVENYGWSSQKDFNLMPCVQGEISQKCAHCIFVSIGG